MPEQPLLETRGLSKYYYPARGFFQRKATPLKALENVDLQIYPQETLGVVGESGCGKTTLGRVMLHLIPPTSGKVLYSGEDLTKLRGEALKQRRREMQIVFQNPYQSFDPRFSISRSLSEPLRTHTPLKGEALHSRLCELLEQVGLPPEALARYPHEFSGGQLQRVAVARALALNPRFIVLDEPTSALDVSVQAQILNLLKALQKQHQLTYLFISHDLSVVEYISNRVAVMYLGKIVELLSTEQLFAGGERHPYTRALLAAVPQVFPEKRAARPSLSPRTPDALRPPLGCSFHPRCPVAVEACAWDEPSLVEIRPGHEVACHLVQPEK